MDYFVSREECLEDKSLVNAFYMLTNDELKNIKEFAMRHLDDRYDQKRLLVKKIINNLF